MRLWIETDQQVSELTIKFNGESAEATVVKPGSFDSPSTVPSPDSPVDNRFDRAASRNTGHVVAAQENETNELLDKIDSSTAGREPVVDSGLSDFSM